MVFNVSKMVGLIVLKLDKCFGIQRYEMLMFTLCLLR